ncbi:MAG: hypothetical protein MUC38_03775 [Cyclobacteriaceae bacterium]|jgi:hypothetical protein|nr:hypothetical protein [Cyclobacteriaceae bacterium]
MKATKFLLVGMLAAGLALFTACETNEPLPAQQSILPERFGVAIPSSLTATATVTGRAANRSQTDTLKGNDIYLNLQTFIWVGESASKFVNEFIGGIRQFDIDRVLAFTFVSEDDGRVKNLTVETAVAFEGATWDYLLTITDVNSANEADRGIALQLFWNQDAPIRGIAICKLYHADRVEHANAPEAVFRINYQEGGTRGYEAEMEVLISGLPLATPLEDPYSIRTLRMFAGKKGDIVDVYGNSHHPNALFFTGTKAFNWAFVASGNEATDMGVAEVGLPLSSLNSRDRETLLKAHSIRNVFQREITTAWPGIDQGLLAAYLANTAAPGFFNEQGFIQGGESPGSSWTTLAARLENLTPYNPAEVSALNVTFK